MAMSKTMTTEIIIHLTHSGHVRRKDRTESQGQAPCRIQGMMPVEKHPRRYLVQWPQRHSLHIERKGPPFLWAGWE